MLFLVCQFAQEAAHWGESFLGVFELGDGGDRAEAGVKDDLLDLVVDEFGFSGGLGAGEVEGGDLEAVEEEAGAPGIDGVVGDTAEDLADGELDGPTVLGQGKNEDGVAGLTVLPVDGFRLRDRLAGGVVEVAKFFSAEAWTAATEAFGVDVAALEAFGLLGWM